MIRADRFRSIMVWWHPPRVRVRMTVGLLLLVVLLFFLLWFAGPSSHDVHPSFLFAPDFCVPQPPALLVRLSSSGVYSHPLLRQGRPDLAATISRTITQRPTQRLPPREESHSGVEHTFIHHDDNTQTCWCTARGSKSGSDTATTRRAVARTRRTPPDHAALLLQQQDPSILSSSNDSPNKMTDCSYHYSDKYNSRKSYYKNISSSSTPPPPTRSSPASRNGRLLVAPRSQRTKNRHTTTFPPNDVLAALVDDELATHFVFPRMNAAVNGGGEGLRREDQQHDFLLHSSTNRNSSSTPDTVPTSTVTSHSTTSTSTTSDDGARMPWNNHDPSEQRRPIPSLTGLQQQEQEEQLLDSAVLHDEDIRFEIIRTFLQK